MDIKWLYILKKMNKNTDVQFDNNFFIIAKQKNK